MSSHNEAYNSVLSGILQREGNLDGFLDVIFGFLSSRTDFFCEMKHEKQTYGFPPGVAKELVMRYFTKYQKVQQDANDKMEKLQKEKAIKDEEDQVKQAVPTHDSNVAKTDKVVNTVNNSQSSTQKATTTVTCKNGKENKLTTQEEFQMNPDSYNGAVRHNYSWSQNYEDVDVKVAVSTHIKRGKQVRVVIEQKHLVVKVEDADGNFVEMINDELHDNVKTEDSMWSLDPCKEVQITLTKDRSYWWKTLVISEEEIDIQKINPTRPMNDLDDEEQATINKLKFDEHQKMLGKPTSHEHNVHEMLKKGWNAEGSPFAGQEFDPKMFQISNSSTG